MLNADEIIKHRRAWRDALVLAYVASDTGPDETNADATYWFYELEAFDRLIPDPDPVPGNVRPLQRKLL